MAKHTARDHSGVMKPPALFAALAALAFVASSSSVARAQPPDPALMARLADYAARFDSLRSRASYTIDGRLEFVDGEGKASGVRAMKARFEGGAPSRFTILRYTEDGQDKTEEARKEARESSAKPKKQKRLHMPLEASEQPRYAFDQVEVDAADPARVRIAFTPKVGADDTIEGSAWVDATTGSLLSAAFKLSKTPMFVDYVHFVVQFDTPTPVGRAVSTIAVDGGGGFLFFRKHFQGIATLSDYRLP